MSKKCRQISLPREHEMLLEKRGNQREIEKRCFLEGTNSAIYCKYRTLYFLMAKNELLFEPKTGQTNSQKRPRIRLLWHGAGAKVAMGEHQLSTLGSATWGRMASWKGGLTLRKPLPRSPIKPTEGTRHSNSTERSGNVYENKWSRPKTPG